MRSMAPSRLLLLFFCLLAAVSACTSEISYSTPAAWLVSDGSNELFLLGSIHYGIPEMYPLHPLVETAYENADVVVFEAHQYSDEEAYQYMLGVYELLYEYGRYWGRPRSIFHDIPDYLYDALAEYFAADESWQGWYFYMYKPWALAWLLMENDQEPAGDSKFELGIEHYFAVKAVNDHKVILSLEGPTQRIEYYELLFQLFDGTDIYREIAIDYMKEYLDIADSSGDLLSHSGIVSRTLFDAWISGDIDMLHELIDDLLWLLDEPVGINDIDAYEHAIKEYFHILIEYRNHMWLPQIEAMIRDEQQYFVAVGAAHFPGEQGLISLLEDAGYTVHRLSYDCSLQ
ncbi:TraB/GumN family protein [Spirochaeta dissipatitropha]